MAILSDITKALAARGATVVEVAKAIMENVAEQRNEARLNAEGVRRFGNHELAPAAPTIPDTCTGPLSPEENGMAFHHGQPMSQEDAEWLEHWYRREKAMQEQGRWYDLRAMFPPTGQKTWNEIGSQTHDPPKVRR